ncbi:MAG: DUF5667 domain-containing protein [Candidatus Pacebacteria bacterium]|nr:DUF5667 domain-containing protein [Candidatus Paceibacterota bacterium]
MQKIFKFIIPAVAILAIAITSVCLAQEVTDTSVATSSASQEIQQDETVAPSDLGVSEPTLLPDSKFYFLKNWKNAIQSVFTFGQVNKAELNLKIASEKLLEAQKLAEKTDNPQILDKATELYNQRVEKIQENIAKFKGTATSSDKIGKFLDKYVKQQILHEKILDKLETKVPTSTMEKIQQAREQHLIKFGQVMQKLASTTQVKTIIQNAVGAIQGSSLKDIKNLEILKNIQDKMPESIKQQIQNVIASTTQNIKEKIQILSPTQQQKVQNYIENIQGKIEKKKEVINDIKNILPSTSAIKQKFENIKEKLQGATTTQNIVGGDKDEHGCIGSAGYSWCEIKQKCLRTWEEKCEAAATSTMGL